MALLIAWVLVLHFIADFICQTDWQAKNKSKDNRALFSHVLTYTTVFTIGMIPIIPLANPSPFICLYPIFNGIAHFAVDYVTSRINSALWASGNVHNFFVGVGADQLIHHLTLIGTLFLFL